MALLLYLSNSSRRGGPRCFSARRNLDKMPQADLEQEGPGLLGPSPISVLPLNFKNRSVVMFSNSKIILLLVYSSSLRNSWGPCRANSGLGDPEIPARGYSGPSGPGSRRVGHASNRVDREHDSNFYSRREFT